MCRGCPEKFKKSLRPAVRIAQLGVGRAIAGAQPSTAVILDDRAVAVAYVQLRQAIGDFTAHKIEPADHRQEKITHTLRDGIPHGRHARDAIGQIQHAGRDRFALDLITREQLRGRAAPNDERDLPGQIECVLDAGVHPLPARRTVDVGGIARQKNAQLAKFPDFAVRNVETRNPTRIARLHPRHAALIDQCLRFGQSNFGQGLAAGVGRNIGHHAPAIFGKGDDAEHAVIAQKQDAHGPG